MNGCQAVFVLKDLAFLLEEIHYDIFVGIFSCEVQGRVAVIVIGICINFVLEKHFSDIQVAPKSSDMKSIPVELGDPVDIRLVLTKQLDYIIMTFVAGIV